MFRVSDIFLKIKNDLLKCDLLLVLIIHIPYLNVSFAFVRSAICGKLFVLIICINNLMEE